MLANVPDHTPLQYAAFGGPNAGDIVSVLAASGAAVNDIAEMHGTPLSMALRGKPESSRDPGVYHPAPAIRVLVAVGADPHARNPYNYSAVENAICGDRVEILSLFFELGVDPNHRGPFNPPLGDLLSDETSVELESDDELREDFGGESLLHFAARMRSPGAVELLLAAGAREDIPAVEDPKQKQPEIATLPADVIGVGLERMTTEDQRRANAIRAMLAGAHLYRKGWLSVLRSRFDAGESLTGVLPMTRTVAAVAGAMAPKAHLRTVRREQQP